MFGKLIELFSGSSTEKELTEETNDLDKEEEKRIIFLFNSSYSDLFSILEKEAFDLLVLPMFDQQVKYFYMDYFFNLFRVVKFYHKQFGTWNEAFRTSKWTKINHPRLANLKDMDFHIIDSIITAEKRDRSKSHILLQAHDAAYRLEISKRVMLHLLLLFDGYCYSVWKYLASSTMSIWKGSLSIGSSRLFTDKHQEEYNLHCGVTKNIIVESFFFYLKDKPISPNFIFLFKILIKWRIPLNKAISGFPDGNLIELPVVSQNDIVTRHAEHLAAFLALQTDDFNFSPPVYFDKENASNPYARGEIFIPSVINNPEIENILNIEKMLTKEAKE